jgi:uncharacterized protein YlxW (UPF0749 family)
MEQRRRPQWWHPRASSIGIVLVATAAGLLFATSARLFSSDDRETPVDIADLIRLEGERLDVLEADVVALRVERDALLDEIDDTLPKPDEAVLVSAAGTALEGPGLRVELWDAPAVDLEDLAFDVNDLVVHQQDIEAVMNALWAGGAEAMTVQGERLTATSSVRCVGNVLLLHGRQYSPPYVIEAIGDPAALRRSLDTSEEVDVYLQYVDAVGLGWAVTDLESVTMPPYGGTLTLTHAQPLEEAS